jgi:hypothetical protein
MSNTDESIRTDSFDSISDDDNRIVYTQSHCFYCKVQLNLIGLSHTKSAKCNFCSKVVCINCLESKKISKKNICKKCSIIKYLTSENSEIDVTQAHILELKQLIKAATQEKTQAADIRIKNEKLITHKKTLLVQKFSEKISDYQNIRNSLLTESILLLRAHENREKLLKVKSNEVLCRNNDLNKAQMELQNTKCKNEAIDVEIFSTNQALVQEVEKLQADLNQKIDRNRKIALAFAKICEEFAIIKIFTVKMERMVKSIDYRMLKINQNMPKVANSDYSELTPNKKCICRIS